LSLIGVKTPEKWLFMGLAKFLSQRRGHEKTKQKTEVIDLDRCIVDLLGIDRPVGG